MTLPQTAITYNPYGDTVYLVEQKGAARYSAADLRHHRATRGDQVAVLRAEGGRRVVTAGQIKLHNGSPVMIDNKVQPTADAAPTPVDH